MKNRILIWGTGKRVKNYMKKAYFGRCSIEGFVDTYKSDSLFMGCPVYEPTEIPDIMEKIDYLIIANQYFMEILDLCVTLKIDWDKIVLTDAVAEPLFNRLFEKLESISEPLYDKMKNQRMCLIKVNEFDIKDKNKVFGTNKYAGINYMRDYFRFRTFEYLAEEILKNNVPGAVAELGVFRGTFASMINKTFKNKKLYLFDTFEGFDENETEKEVESGRCDKEFVIPYKQTSVNLVLKNIPYPEQCVICKGLFPDSLIQEAIDETYAFVSIDVDFEESTYQGLSFFYPRLSEGGAIFVHDYHTFFLDGVKKSVERFENDFKVTLKKIPLADRAGTLVIIK